MVFQILYKLFQAQKYNFVHNDLFNSNVLVKFVKPKTIKYIVDNLIFELFNFGINIILIDFEFSQITINNTYIFNYDVQQKYYPEQYTVLNTQSADICKILKNSLLDVITIFIM